MQAEKRGAKNIIQDEGFPIPEGVYKDAENLIYKLRLSPEYRELVEEKISREDVMKGYQNCSERTLGEGCHLGYQKVWLNETRKREKEVQGSNKKEESLNQGEHFTMLEAVFSVSLWLCHPFRRRQRVNMIYSERQKYLKEAINLSLENVKETANTIDQFIRYQLVQPYLILIHFFQFCVHL